MIEENMLRGSLVTSNEAKGGIAYKGERGYSNYEIYVKNGGTMTEEEWLEHFGVDLTGYAKTSEVIEYVGDLENLETIDKTDIVSAINEHQSSIDELDTKTTPEYCVASLDSAISTNTNTTIPLNYFSQFKGNFTLSNNGIRIGAGINHVKLSGQISTYADDSDYKWFWTIIRKNGNNVVSRVDSASNTGYLASNVGPIIESVNEGDIITLVVDGKANMQVSKYTTNTYLCIEKID
jgi:hypothetical protein